MRKGSSNYADSYDLHSYRLADRVVYGHEVLVEIDPSSPVASPRNFRPIDAAFYGDTRVVSPRFCSLPSLDPRNGSD